jgi:phospholipase C
VTDTTKTYTCQSIFGLLSTHGVSWAMYGYDAEPLTRLNFPDTTSAPDTNFGMFADFTKAAASGSLPSYTFLEPAWASTGNSQHPNYDVALGEQLIHDVYYALRSGPAWATTLLVITYDEHGGCFDHVPPPSGAVPPDASASPSGFDFARFGVRVPAVLVSPLIEAGTVFRVPSGTMPLDHTSILRTVENRFGIPALTARDAAAPDLSGVLTLPSPRSDDPLAGVVVPTSTGVNPAAQEPSHLQQVHAELLAELPVPDASGSVLHTLPALHTTDDYTAYINERTAAWKASRRAGPSST